MSEKNQNKSTDNKRLTEPEWIDLEKEPQRSSEGHAPKNQTSGKKSPKKKKAKLNLHVVLLSLIALVFVVIAFKLLFWGKREHHNTELENDTTLSFDTEALDSIVPLDATNPGDKEIDKDLRILFVGNGSLADDKTSDTNLANIVQKKTGATVYNCAIPGSYMSIKNQTYQTSCIYDAFSFYFLSTFFASGNTTMISQAEGDMGGSLPVEVQESIDLLQSIDYSELDVLCVYYDAADYRDQRPIIDLDNETDPTTFCGALQSGIELIKESYPHVRIIVMSPSYAYAVDENGNLSSSFEKDVLEENLALYVGMESTTCIKNNVSFVDNFYGSIYEEIADEYLKDDGILLNEKGHALLADRFMGALNQFHDYDF